MQVGCSQLLKEFEKPLEGGAPSRQSENQPGDSPGGESIRAGESYQITAGLGCIIFPLQVAGFSKFTVHSPLPKCVGSHEPIQVLTCNFF